ncbi:amphi-Trp domain-containing protein [Halovenus sp. WSH3]|uniref:Amphi-Trp domain-containing protein n=1 Tax=Halovenus carboxidivorans TaxID=2692199 RepID=A0A6B0T6F5_9EURY|nr:amphi-Trp domain-containing protein [Halovenus carboxidivorans]MXR50801.1 amphi-Trp domain-containing protein [Halovenus carboxidivorans]
MADQTTNAERMDRAAVAERLTDLAEELRSGEEMKVRVGNKNVVLTPSETVSYRIDVVEKQSRFRGSRETVRIEIDWKP